MRIIGFCNLKGGVGKTTACQNIAVGLARLGKKVAVVDMDPQSNLSAGFGIMPSPSDPQVFDLLAGEASWDEILIRKEDVDIIPSSLNLVMAELNNKGPLSQDTVLRDAVKKIDPFRYDYILMDSPPQLGIFTRNVLTACSKIVVPMDGGFYSLLGLKLLETSLQVFRERLNPELEIAGVLMTNYNPRLYIARQVFDDVKKNFSDAVFENYIRQNVTLVEAASMGMSIFSYDAKSKGAECYKAVTEEFMRKFDGEHEPEAVIKESSTHSEAENSQTSRVTEEISSSPETEPEPEPEKEPEPEQVITELPEDTPDPVIEPEKPEVEPAKPDIPEEKPQTPPPPPPEPVKIPDGPLGVVISMLPEERRRMWLQMLEPMMITKRRLNVDLLRDDFEDSDRSRFTFYILDEEEDNLWPVMLSEQIEEPLRCALKIDENDGWAEVYL
ncbi:MAG: ParA family protein [Synergistaceae bacterium]|nr:ParA family protein [Synergistaceae bacterium]